MVFSLFLLEMPKLTHCFEGTKIEFLRERDQQEWFRLQENDFLDFRVFKHSLKMGDFNPCIIC